MKKLDDFHLIQAVREGRQSIKDSSDNQEFIRAEVTTYIISLLEEKLNEIIEELNYQRDARAKLEERLRMLEDERIH